MSAIDPKRPLPQRFGLPELHERGLPPHGGREGGLREREGPLTVAKHRNGILQCLYARKALGLASHHHPTSYWDIVGRDNPRKGMPTVRRQPRRRRTATDTMRLFCAATPPKYTKPER